jgi:hypothetical protein
MGVTGVHGSTSIQPAAKISSKSAALRGSRSKSHRSSCTVLGALHKNAVLHRKSAVCTKTR